MRVKFALYLYDPARRIWLYKQGFTDEGEANENAEMFRHKGRRTRIEVRGS